MARGAKSKKVLGGQSIRVEAYTPLHDLLRLRRDTAQPLYLQLEQQISALVQDGSLAPGVTLPPERGLALALGVSRATVQQSYNALRARHLLRGEGRRGSVVQPFDNRRLAPGMDRLRGFTQEMRELGRIPSTRVLEREIVTDRSIASLFGQASDSRFLRLMRVRYGDDQPMTVESAWYSLDVAPMLAETDGEGSMYEAFRRAGHPLAYCDQTVEATTPSPAECAVFGFKEPTPCLLIKRRSYVGTGAMVEYVEGLFRGDAYVYRLRLDA